MKWEVIQFLMAPFCICLILTGIHVYLGIHVISRGVIFVDLALAQIAALGATVAFLCGLPHEGGATYFVSLAFTLLGAAVFAMTRNVEKRKVPQEAIIGVTYAISSAAIILLMDKSSHGAEHIKDMLVGNILWVTWPEVLMTLGLYSLISIFHFKFRKQFLLISLNPEEAKRKKYSLKLWDMLFYSSFGFVITSSVKVAGVLLVFSYLVVPSVIGMLFSRTIRGRLMIGWGVGFLASVFGLTASYFFDLPTGACLVVLFGILLFLAGLIRKFI
ncbi:MAG: metal ABC transporter permease [Deltaproteobacteria bacterium]|nr:metal ABC transporter permease [Deltaproteobacteria bacterium]